MEEEGGRRRVCDKGAKEGAGGRQGRRTSRRRRPSTFFPFLLTARTRAPRLRCCWSPHSRTRRPSSFGLGPLSAVRHFRSGSSTPHVPAPAPTPLLVLLAVSRPRSTHLSSPATTKGKQRDLAESLIVRLITAHRCLLHSFRRSWFFYLRRASPTGACVKMKEKRNKETRSSEYLIVCQRRCRVCIVGVCVRIDVAGSTWTFFSVFGSGRGLGGGGGGEGGGMEEEEGEEKRRKTICTRTHARTQSLGVGHSLSSRCVCGASASTSASWARARLTLHPIPSLLTHARSATPIYSPSIILPSSFLPAISLRRKPASESLFWASALSRMRNHRHAYPPRSATPTPTPPCSERASVATPSQGERNESLLPPDFIIPASALPPPQDRFRIVCQGQAPWLLMRLCLLRPSTPPRPPALSERVRTHPIPS